VQAAGPVPARSKKNNTFREEPMRHRHLFVAASSAFAMLLSGPALAQTQGPSLTGLVSSAEENAMEGCW
jgi:hypothetical protein